MNLVGKFYISTNDRIFPPHQAKINFHLHFRSLWLGCTWKIASKTLIHKAKNIVDILYKGFVDKASIYF